MTDEKALDEINDHLHIDARITFDNATLKCCLRDEDGGTGKAYLDAGECARLAAAFEYFAAALTKGNADR
jgi:hypothetical protein